MANLEGHTGLVYSVAFHPTAPLLATGSHDRTAKLWLLSPDNSSATCVATLRGHTYSVESVAFHPTAPILATGSGDGTAKLWLLSSDNLSATCVATLEGHRDSVNSVAFHPNGRVLATGSSDNTAKLWDCSILSLKSQRSMALVRGVEPLLLSRLFSGRMRNMPYAAQFLRNTLKQRGPNFFKGLEQQARAAAASRRAMATARAPIKAMAMIEGPKPRSSSPSSKPRSSSPSKSHPRSPSKPPSPKSPKSTKPSSPKEDKSGGGGRTSITHRRRSHSSRKVKRHASKTRRYRKFR